MNSFRNRITTVSLLIVLAAVTAVFYVVFRIAGAEFKSIQDGEIEQHIRSVSSSIENLYAFSEDYERVINEKLYYISESLDSRIGSSPVGSISQGELDELIKEYGLSGISIFVPDGKEFRIAKSSNRKEIGAGTSSWGYWNRAFAELYSGKAVSVDKGTAIGERFWVGPVAKSHVDEGSFRYAYRLSKSGDFIINAIISDSAMDKYTLSGRLDSLVDGIVDNVAYIDAMVIIDSAAWKTHDKTRDPYVICGGLGEPLLTMYSVTPELLAQKGRVEVDLEGGGGRLIVTEINDKVSMAIKTNMNAVNRIGELLTLTIVVLGAITLGLAGISTQILISRMSGYMEAERKRGEFALVLQETIKRMPDIIFRCKLVDGRIMVTYNEGRNRRRDDLVVDPASPVPLEEVFSIDYLEMVKDRLVESFEGRHAKFEASFGGRDFEHMAAPISITEGDGESEGYVTEILVMGTDVTDRNEKANDSRMQARSDALTGMPNRLAFREAFENADCRGIDPMGFGLLYMDLDGFKAVNDRLGHATGDNVLIEVSRRIMALCTDKFYVARLGGDEFAGIVMSGGTGETERLAREIDRVVSAPYHIDGMELEIGVSVGKSLYPDHGETYEELLVAADKDMYRVKAIRKR